MMKVLILLSCLAYSIHAANPDADNGMFQTMYNYLKSQPILLQEEQRQVIEFLFFNEIDQLHFWCSCRDSNPGPLRLGKSLTVRPAKSVKNIAEGSEACCKGNPK